MAGLSLAGGLLICLLLAAMLLVMLKALWALWAQETEMHWYTGFSWKSGVKIAFLAAFLLATSRQRVQPTARPLRTRKAVSMPHEGSGDAATLSSVYLHAPNLGS